MITFCIPSKNNLRYLKNSILSIRQNSFHDNKIIVFVDTDNDGTVQWLQENNVHYLFNNSSIPDGISYGYNRCIEAATTDIVCMFHADMYMAKGFDIGLLKYIKRGTVVSGTRIEPPLHPKGFEKIVKDFGMYPEDFKKDEFENYSKKAIAIYKDKTTNGIFAPWALYKDDITCIGMHDETLVSCHEDSDLFQRFILNGYELIQTWESLVYHLTCRGGQFQDGVEQTTTNELYHKRKKESEKTFIRKWGHAVKVDSYCRPIIPNKYDIGLCIINCVPHIFDFFEPYCSNINKPLDNNVEITFDARMLTQESAYIFTKIIESPQNGICDIFKVVVNRNVPQDLSSLIKN